MRSIEWKNKKKNEEGINRNSQEHFKKGGYWFSTRPHYPYENDRNG